MQYLTFSYNVLQIFTPNLCTQHFTGIQKKNDEISESRIAWERSSHESRKIANLSPGGRNRVRTVVSEELRSVWRYEKDRMVDKAKKLYEKMYPNREQLPSEYRGVKLGDKELLDKFGDSAPKIACYGGIEPSDNVKAFLSLPAKFRIYTS